MAQWTADVERAELTTHLFVLPLPCVQDPAAGKKSGKGKGKDKKKAGEPEELNEVSFVCASMEFVRGYGVRVRHC